MCRVILIIAIAASVPGCPGCAAGPPVPDLVERVERFRELVAAAEYDAARAMMVERPRRWFELREGDGIPWTVGPSGAGPWAAWDEHFRSRTELLRTERHERRVTFVYRETNDYFALLERGWVTNESTYFFDTDGRIEGLLIKATGERPPGRTAEFLAWARTNHPQELDYLMPGGEIDPSSDRPPRFRKLLDAWRAASGLEALRDVP